MNFRVSIHQDEDGMYIVDCPSIPGCISQGKTEEEALRNIQSAIAECLAVRRDEGMPLTITCREVSVAV